MRIPGVRVSSCQRFERRKQISVFFRERESVRTEIVRFVILERDGRRNGGECGGIYVYGGGN